MGEPIPRSRTAAPAGSSPSVLPIPTLQALRYEDLHCHCRRPAERPRALPVAVAVLPGESASAVLVRDCFPFCGTQSFKQPYPGIMPFALHGTKADIQNFGHFRIGKTKDVLQVH